MDTLVFNHPQFSMKTYHESGTLHVFFSREDDEFIFLDGTGIETILQDYSSGDDLGIKVNVILNKEQKDRLDVKWNPEDASWNDLQKITLSINPNLYKDISEKEKSVERYSNGNIHFAIDYTRNMI